MRLFALCVCFLVVVLITGSCASPLDDFSDHQNLLRSPAIKLARDAARTYLTTGKLISAPTKMPPLFGCKAGVFVTIAKNGTRRGCKGTFEPACANLADEIIRSAVGAATGDIRYRPIRSNELADLTFTVSITGPLKRVRETAGYSPAVYGLLLRTGSGSGVILPGEAKTSAWRLAEARRQAGVRSGSTYELFVFKTVALHEAPMEPDKRRR